MKTKKLALLGLLGAASISSMAFAPSVEAVVLTFDFGATGATFDGGGTLTGSFSYNTVSNTYFGASIISSAGALTGPSGLFVNPFTYTTVNTDLSPTSTIVAFSSPVTNTPGVQNRTLTLRFSTALNTLNTIGQTSNLLNTGSLSTRANDFYVSADGGIEQRDGITGGAVRVTAVPFNSNEFPLVASGVLLAGGFWLKRKRGQSQIELAVSEPQPQELVTASAE